jgi:hypothetical protein
MHKRCGIGLTATVNEMSAWAEWDSFLDHAVCMTSVPRGTAAVNLLRRFLNADQTPGTELLKLVRQQFEIERMVGRDIDGFPLPGQGWVRIRRDVGSHRRTEVAVGAATPSRRRSVEAHEIAHLFYASLVERITDNPPDHRVRTEEAERFCWEFALEISCPHTARVQWTPEFLDSLLGTRDREAILQFCPKELSSLTFWHIRALAQRYGISMRMVIAALDRHPILDRIGFGISTFRRMSNPVTLKDVGLRVSQYARPSWGFLIPNQRVFKQGFLSAGSIFDRGENQWTVTVAERLCLKNICGDRQVKWALRNIETTCAYTPIDVKSEGRYLLVIWPWPLHES